MNLTDKIFSSFKNFFPERAETKRDFFIPLDFSFPFFNANKKTDAQILNDGYLSNADFFSIIRKISEAARTLPLYTSTVKGSKEIINEGFIYNLIKNPNQEDSQEDFLEKCTIELLISGDLFIRFVGAELGKPLEMLVLRSCLVSIQSEKYFYNLKEIPKQEILHIKFYDPSADGELRGRGLSLGNPSFNILDASNELAVADAWTLKNKGAGGMLVNEGIHKLTPEEATLIQDSVNKNIGGAKNKNKVSVSGAKLNYLQLSMSPTDLQIQESYIVKMRQMCNVFGLDSSLFNDPANKRFNNLQEAKKFLYDNAVIPLVERILNRINKKLSKYEPTTILIEKASIDALQTDQIIQVDKKVKESLGISDVLQKLNTNMITKEQAIFMLKYTWMLSDEEINELKL